MSKSIRSRDTRRFYLKLAFIQFLILFPFIIFSDRLYVISSQSMAPTLNVGDLVVRGDKDAEDIKADEEDGDIVILRGATYFYEKGFDPIFWGNLDGDVPIIHRAIDKKKIDGKWYFKTKGDNNMVADGGYTFKNKSKDYDYIVIEYNDSEVIYICETEVLGIVIFIIPYLGYLNLYFPVIFVILISIIASNLILKLLDYEITVIKRSNNDLVRASFKIDLNQALNQKRGLRK
ncbi:MAG: signal peptidase I [Promethearchaeota archaeon]